MVKRDIEPSALLKQVAMPGWVEMRLSRVTPRTAAAKRFAIYALDRWEGTTELPEPHDIASPRAVAGHYVALELLGGRKFWTIAAVTVSLAALLFASENAAAILLPAVWAGWLVVVLGSWMLREATEASVREYRIRLEAAERAAQRKNAPRLSGDEVHSLTEMLSTTEGKLAYAAAVLAGETETSPVWDDPVFDDFHARVDLRRHVGEIAESARALARARGKLGARPGGALADDEAVTDLYERRINALDGRLSTLTQRVHGLLIYRDHVRGFEPLIEKRKWLEAHREDQFDDGTTTDELGSAEVRSATEEVDSLTREAMNFLLEDAERLGKL